MGDKLRAVFNEFDEDKDGHIDAYELKRAFEKAGMQPAIEEINELIKEVDLNKNGKVEWNEFAALYEKIQKNEYAERVGGMAKLLKLRMQDVGKYPPGPTGKWKKVSDSGYYGGTGGGVYKKDKKPPPPKKSISDLP